MFSDITTPNIPDFNTFSVSNGVPASSIPSGTLTTLAINTAGAASAASITGTVSAGEIILGAGIPEATYITSWTSLSGTVSPAPLTAVSVASASSYSIYVAWALNYALEVAIDWPGIGSRISGYAGSYLMAVYNLALHQLLKIGQDAQGATFFSGIRQTYGLTTLRPGVVMASGDENTSQTLVVPEFFKNLTLSELDLIKTPYGRAYLEYAQMYGGNIVAYS